MSSGGDTNKYEAQYEHTPHRLTVVLDSTPPPTRREDIFPDGSAYILYDLLSPSECLQIQQQGLAFGLDHLVMKIRRCQRAAAMGAEFAEALFARARPFLGGSYVLGGREPAPEKGMEMEVPGVFTPQGLNPCFRIVRYQPGGFFWPHRDGGFQARPDLMSLKTFMLYLNDDYLGGPTNFFNDEQLDYKSPEVKNVIYSYQPKQGSCLVFNSSLMHDGGYLADGQKWLLRSELMYSVE
eukprot:PhF_6_TR40989/c0_g1_i1/m.62090